MTKKKITISLTPEAATALELAFAAMGWTGQRGTSLNAGLEHLGQTASAALAETVAALNIAEACAAGFEWREVADVTDPRWS